MNLRLKDILMVSSCVAIGIVSMAMLWEPLGAVESVLFASTSSAGFCYILLKCEDWLSSRKK